MPQRILTRLDALAEWIDRNAKWIYLVMLIITTVIMGFLIYFAFTGQQKIRNLGRENRDRINDIQRERVNNIYNNCTDTNVKHRHAVKVLDKTYASAFKKARPEDIPRIQASKKSVILLLNALAPSRNCNELLVETVPSAVER